MEPTPTKGPRSSPPSSEISKKNPEADAKALAKILTLQDLQTTKQTTTIFGITIWTSYSPSKQVTTLLLTALKAHENPVKRYTELTKSNVLKRALQIKQAEINTNILKMTSSNPSLSTTQGEFSTSKKEIGLKHDLIPLSDDQEKELTALGLSEGAKQAIREINTKTSIKEIRELPSKGGSAKITYKDGATQIIALIKTRPVLQTLLRFPKTDKEKCKNTFTAILAESTVAAQLEKLDKHYLKGAASFQ